MNAIASPTRLLQVSALTAERFAPFGDVIEITEHTPHFTVNQGTATRYHDLAHLQPGSGRIGISLFHSEPCALPIEISILENHPLGSQSFYPVSGQTWLVVVAPPGNNPQSNEIRAFLARPDQGINYAPGVWHHPVITLHDAATFLVIDRIGTGQNCVETLLAEPLLIKSVQ